jgi:DivIVA domain-containing protein
VTLVLTLLIMAVLALVVAVATGRIVGGLDRPASSLPGRGLPPGPIGVDDVERVRFSPALRGYRMDEVDDALDRLTEELHRRDEEIAELRARWASGRLTSPGAFPGRALVGDRPGADADAAPPARRPDGDITRPPRLPDGDDTPPSVLDHAYDTHGVPLDATEPAALWRRPPNGARPQMPTPPPGVPATPPGGRHDERGRRR